MYGGKPGRLAQNPTHLLGVKKSSTQDPEIDALLAVLALPEPSPEPSTLSPGDAVALFLADNDLRPGFSPGVEVSALYRFYRDWLADLDQPTDPITPQRFARALKKLGFVGASAIRSCAPTSGSWGCRTTAPRGLRAWLQANPLTENDVALFDPAKRWAKRKEK